MNESIIEALAIVLFMSIPIAAIVGHAINRNRRLRLEERKLELGTHPQLAEGDAEKLKDALRYTLEENELLKKRLETLETIVTSVDWDRLPQVKEPHANNPTQEA